MIEWFEQAAIRWNAIGLMIAAVLALFAIGLWIYLIVKAPRDDGDS